MTKGLVEIKCPEHAAHMDFLLTGSVPTDYVTQMQWQMACTGADWVDYVSYHPDFPPNMQLRIMRFERDDARVESMEEEVRKFVEEVKLAVDFLKGKYGE